MRQGLFTTSPDSSFFAFSSALRKLLTFQGMSQQPSNPGINQSPYVPCRNILSSFLTWHSCIFFLSCWYTKDELPSRIAIFYSGYTLASAFGGLIAAGIISSMEGLGGYPAWVSLEPFETGLQCSGAGMNPIQSSYTMMLYSDADMLLKISDGFSSSKVLSQLLWASLAMCCCRITRPIPLS